MSFVIGSAAVNVAVTRDISGATIKLTRFINPLLVSIPTKVNVTYLLPFVRPPVASQSANLSGGFARTSYPLGF
jgi:hypothetical protein